MVQAGETAPRAGKSWRVNLRAGDEADKVQEQIDTMTAEHEELTAAINKLRHGIGQFNREAAAFAGCFETVNGHFKRLFTQLFVEFAGDLTESDDPLQAGLEILAHPPGKNRKSCRSYLAGTGFDGHGTIFAVFLTNPSPICVLDEVDAPLDDANVERFSNLLADETGNVFGYHPSRADDGAHGPFIRCDHARTRRQPIAVG